MRSEAGSTTDFDPEQEVRPEDTRRALLDAGLALFHERFLEQITLKELAARAGCSVDDAIRVFGSRENVFPEFARDLAGRMPSARFAAPPGDVRIAVFALLEDYETWGDILVRALAQEERIPELGRFLKLGRAVHRDWVERTFGGLLEKFSTEQRRLRLAQLVGVCDVTFWRMLRRESNLDPAETHAALVSLVEAVLDVAPTD